MRTWMLATATTLVAVAGLAGESAAELSAAEPWSSPPLRGSPAGPRVFPATLARTTSYPQGAAPAHAPAITGHANIGQGTVEQGAIDSGYVGGATIAQTAWNHEHAYTGYVYTPGGCDYTPPCVNHLWDGYCQRPLRCRPHGHHFHRGCGTAVGCGTCNTGCSGSGGLSFGGCHGCRLHGGRLAMGFGNCDRCSTAAPACDSCDTCGGGGQCFGGHGLGHFSRKCRTWFTGLCNACDGGMSCGCAAPVDNQGLPGGPSAEVLPTPATDNAPMPMADDDDGKSARRPTLNRYLPWSFK